MTKYEYLRLPKRLRLQIDHIENRIEILKDKAQGIKSANNSPMVTGSPNPFRSQNDICDYVNLEKVVEQKKKQLKEVVANIETAIYNMDVNRTQQVLECRFIDGWTIEMIMECYGYTDSCNVYHLIRKGVEKLPLNVDSYTG